MIDGFDVLIFMSDDVFEDAENSFKFPRKGRNMADP